MNSFTQSQRVEALFWLSLFHLLVIISSNYLVQLPISIFGFHTTGRVQFPVYFPCDGFNRAYFWRTAGAADYFAVMIGTVCLLRHLLAVLHGKLAGLRSADALQPVRRAYCHRQLYGLRPGQILDVHVFNRLRQNHRWWMAPTASTLFGNVSDTLAFFFIAFWRSPDAFMAEHWMEIALVDYAFKGACALVFFLPMYGVLLNMLLKRLADKSEISALQAG